MSLFQIIFTCHSHKSSNHIFSSHICFQQFTQQFSLIIFLHFILFDSSEMFSHSSKRDKKTNNYKNDKIICQDIKFMVGGWVGGLIEIQCGLKDCFLQNKEIRSFRFCNVFAPF